MQKTSVLSRSHIKCPKCGALTTYDATNRSRPFCSDRCKNDDIVAWAQESYGIPGSIVESNLQSSEWGEGMLDDEI